MKTGKTMGQKRRGATVVETAVVLLIALLLTFAIYDYGRYFMLSQLVNNACREGARQAVANTNQGSTYTATIQGTVIQYLANQSLTNSKGASLSTSDVNVYQVNPATGSLSSDSNWYDSTFGSSISVSVTAKFKPFFPTFGFLPSTVTLQGCAVMSSEAN